MSVVAESNDRTLVFAPAIAGAELAGKGKWRSRCRGIIEPGTNTAIVALSAWYVTVPDTVRLGTAELMIAQEAQPLQS